ncbi:M24 family metallopeptidase [Marinobacter salarius]|uniref:M24 family metallopeptidase n=2 Tax=Pseudomonadota TaxID=1224 RepID=UPI0032EF4D07
MLKLRSYRLDRVQEQLRLHDYAGIVLYDPINIRYATGTRNMAVWTLHNHTRYAFVPAEGLPTLWEFRNKPLQPPPAAALESVGDIRLAIGWIYFSAGERKAEKVRQWSADLAEVVRAAGGANNRVAFDHLDPLGLREMDRLNIDVMDGERMMERARVIKGPEEIQCMNICVSVADTGMARMHEALKPGMSENELWSILHKTNIELGGEWIETRLLASGGRTNPWFQECGERRIRAGDLVGFDTDLIGPFGYCADLCRTFFCGPGKPSDEQKRLYNLAVEQVEQNMALVRPGVTFKELVEKQWQPPNSVASNRFNYIHGVGMIDEAPTIPNLPDPGLLNEPEGVVEAGMTLCLESYIGEEQGVEGVRLEQQVLVTETGPVVMSTFPYEEVLLS